MAVLANKITIDPENRKVLIDGAEFPWHLDEDGVSIRDLGGKTSIARVSLTVMAGTLEVLAGSGFIEVPSSSPIDVPSSSDGLAV